jgi:aminoglycoside phosphotransferase (APT) family kinase protein
MSMAARKYSERLGVLDDRQLQAALARWGLGDFVRAEPISGGLFGQNVFVSSTKGEWVLRGVPHYDWQLPAERFFCGLLHTRTRAPAPWPYLIDLRDDIFGWSYAVMPRMPGIQPSGGLAREERLGMAQALAENLALMQDLTWPSCGGFELAAETIAAYPASWPAWVAADVDRWLDVAREHSDRTTNADIAWVAGLLSRAKDALAEPFQPCFVMHDYKEQNATFERAGAGWRVSGIFDLMECFFGDGEIDLSRQTLQYLEEDPAIGKAFVRRYLDLRPARPGFRERFSVYALWDRLAIWEYFQRPGQATPWAPGLTLRAWMEPVLEACDLVVRSSVAPSQRE